jgi:putative nucleotidyltransferase with HDIG domain
MLRKPSDTLYIQKQFRVLNTLLLKTLGGLSQVADPLAATAVQDLRKIADSLEQLQAGVSDNQQIGKHQLMALVEVGRLMNSSMGLNRVLEEVMDELISLMQAERGFLMLRNEQGELVVRIARGLAHADLEKEAFALSRTIVKQVAASGEAVLTTDAQEDPRYEKQFSIISLNLRSILCAPLKLKNEVIGVIFVDNRAKAGLFQEKDLEMLSAFADQAAVSIDNARLFDDLQASNKSLEAANVELEIAYEATLNGWVRALDLRDKETEGHTQRVTALTRQLAISLGVSADDLMHITRGALLHDIGKMGIPDSILLKPSGLTLEERELMKQHTVLAYEMLNPIQFLHPAIYIPYCHHEKWDGTGYPRGLREEEIPFMARIFSIVDVWDALTSNRPYRKPVDPAEVRQYIREQSGTYFDPRLVDAFLETVS